MHEAKSLNLEIQVINCINLIPENLQASAEVNLVSKKIIIYLHKIERKQKNLN